MHALSCLNWPLTTVSTLGLASAAYGTHLDARAHSPAAARWRCGDTLDTPSAGSDLERSAGSARWSHRSCPMYFACDQKTGQGMPDVASLSRQALGRGDVALTSAEIPLPEGRSAEEEPQTRGA